MPPSLQAPYATLMKLVTRKCDTEVLSKFGRVNYSLGNFMSL